MHPQAYYGMLSTEYPHRINYESDSSLHIICGLNEVKTCLRSCYPKRMADIRIPLEHADKHARVLNAIFESMEIFKPDFAQMKRVSASAVDRELHELIALICQRGDEACNLVEAWLRPATSRLQFDCVFQEDTIDWSRDIYEAAYRLVSFLDDKYSSDEEYLRGLAFLSGALAKELGVDPFRPSQELAKFAMFATGHETPANVAATVLQNTRGHFTAKIPHLVCEALRFDPPIQSIVRQMAVDVELDGILLKKDDKIRIHLGAASRDCDHFPHPHSFHIANGMENTGVFFGSPDTGCPGRHVAFDIACSLLSIYRIADIAMDLKETQWWHNLDVRGINKMYVDLKPVHPEFALYRST